MAGSIHCATRMLPGKQRLEALETSNVECRTPPVLSVRLQSKILIKRNRRAGISSLPILSVGPGGPGGPRVLAVTDYGGANEPPPPTANRQPPPPLHNLNLTGKSQASDLLRNARKRQAKRLLRPLTRYPNPGPPKLRRSFQSRGVLQDCLKSRFCLESRPDQLGSWSPSWTSTSIKIARLTAFVAAFVNDHIQEFHLQLFYGTTLSPNNPFQRRSPA
ncbi:hypothetical protein BDZ45DRAFT_753454 [Acephala macrosclerotiorum]|nr:hypothetical protein BDZ45DRAFT_753454 [Acephala macrosclerotiorum]